MEIRYDPESDSVNIKFQRGKYEISEEIKDGIIVDLTKDGRVISIEILDASRRIPKNDLNQITVGFPIRSGA